MKLSKRDYEQFALLIVSEILKISETKFKLSEKPDIQNSENSIGIEVTRAITSHEGFTENLVSQHYGKGKSGKEIKQDIQDSVPGFKGFVLVTDNDKGLISSGVQDSCERLERAKESILVKEEKSKDYIKFKCNYLFVFFHWAVYSAEEIKEMLDEVFDSISYDGIFLATLGPVFFKTSSDFIRYDIDEEKKAFLEKILEAS